jgi:hypothetical protein
MVVNSSIVAALGLAVDQSITDIALYWMVQNIILSRNSDKLLASIVNVKPYAQEMVRGVNRETCGVKAESYSFVSKYTCF